MRHAKLCGNDDLVAAMRKRLAHEFFVFIRPVAFSGIEKSVPEIE